MTSPAIDRVVFVGPCASGKSTLGAQLAQDLGVAHVELDALHWEPGWVEAPNEQMAERVRVAISVDRWIVSGNYLTVAQPLVWPRVQTVVWLDLPLWVILPRLAMRTWRRWYSRELLWGTNRERLGAQLAIWDPERSLFAWTLHSHWKRKRTMRAAMADPRWAHIRFVHLRSVGAVDAFLAEIRRACL